MNMSIMVHPYHTLYTVSTEFRFDEIPMRYRDLEIF